MTEDRARRRLFFAVWPSDELRVQIVNAMGEARTQWGGRAVAPENLHVTLLFLGAVAEPRVPLAFEAGAALSGFCFEMSFDQLEIWPGANVLCLTQRRTAPQLKRLHEQLRGQLTSEGFEFRRQKFRAHITLARDVRARRRRDPFSSLRWPVRDVVLVQSNMTKTGSQYAVIGRWALADGPAKETG